MKNLHLIETNKPSVLILRQDRKLFFTGYGGQLGKINGLRKDVPQNIYITNSEEIKKGDWFMSDFNSFPIHNIKELSERGGTLGWKQKDLKNNLKIILTTDQDLIGVQPIDDEFLEWFVKNPSCEWVEVDNRPKISSSERGFVMDNPNYNKIIIPKEKPKQGREKIEEDFLKCISNSKVVYKPKQETTLEEAGEKLYPNREFFLHRFQNIERKAFTEGAKWQMERSYSEEEVFILLAKMADTIFRAPKRFTNSREWFEKHKKK